MNAVQKQRLLDVARACREAPKPNDFTMERFGNQCGTPACALGHYAMRTDLQDRFTLVKPAEDYMWPMLEFDGQVQWCDGEDICEWFGITQDEAIELFASTGCTGYVPGEDEDDDDERPDFVTDPIKAAEYIEDFVRRHEVQP